MVAITAVKNTVAPIPAYLVRSPGEHCSNISVSAPEQKMKNRCSIGTYVLIDELLERGFCAIVTKKALKNEGRIYLIRIIYSKCVLQAFHFFLP